LCTSLSLAHDVFGSVHHSTVHTEKSNKMQQCIKIYYSIFIWSSTCFGRHTAHHQEQRVFAKHWQRPATTCPTAFHICKPEAASAVLGSWWWAVCRPKHVELYINME
jgi:hypothetical protein